MSFNYMSLYAAMKHRQHMYDTCTDCTNRDHLWLQYTLE
jgi:hypothetical protein